MAEQSKVDMDDTISDSFYSPAENVDLGSIDTSHVNYDTHHHSLSHRVKDRVGVKCEVGQD